MRDHLRRGRTRVGGGRSHPVLRPHPPTANPDVTVYVLVQHIDAVPRTATVRPPVTDSGVSGTAAGWRLLALHGGGQRWSLRLDARGAAASAPARTAKAVALRVLREQGVEVTGWRGAGGDREPMFRADHRVTSGTTPR